LAGALGVSCLAVAVAALCKLFKFKKKACNPMLAVTKSY
jgi:hypothetical protein